MCVPPPPRAPVFLNPVARGGAVVLTHNKLANERERDPQGRRLLFFMFIKGPNPTPVWELNLVDLKGSGVVLFFHVLRVPTPLRELIECVLKTCTGKRAVRPERVL